MLSEVQVIACLLLPSGCISLSGTYEESAGSHVIFVTFLRIWGRSGWLLHMRSPHAWARTLCVFSSSPSGGVWLVCNKHSAPFSAHCHRHSDVHFPSHAFANAFMASSRSTAKACVVEWCPTKAERPVPALLNGRRMCNRQIPQ